MMSIAWWNKEYVKHFEGGKWGMSPWFDLESYMVSVAAPHVDTSHTHAHTVHLLRARRGELPPTRSTRAFVIQNWEGGGSSWNNRKWTIGQGDGLFVHRDLGGNFGI